MRNHIKNIIKNPLFSGSAIMIIGANLTNVLNYFYHLIMGRMLGPVNYSELAVLISLIGLLGIIPAAFNPVVVKFVSAAKEQLEIAGLIHYFSRLVITLTVVITLIFITVTPFLSSFLKIDNPILILTAILSFSFMFLAILNRGVLQGLLRFKQILIINTAENGIKLLGGVLLVYLGLSVFGAVSAFATAVILGWYLSKQFITDYNGKYPEQQFNNPQIIRYAIPVLFQSIAFTSIYSMDVILVKHFFEAHQAGIYAALSTLGKIIFFGAGPITTVMFPLVSKRHSRGEKYLKIFCYSFTLTVILSLGVLVIYWLFPRLTINMLFGSEYLEGADYLVKFAIFIMLFTLSYLLTHFYLSLNKVKIVILPLTAALAQTIGIILFHDSLGTVINVSIVVTAILFCSLLLYLTKVIYLRYDS